MAAVYICAAVSAPGVFPGNSRSVSLSQPHHKATSARATRRSTSDALELISVLSDSVSLLVGRSTLSAG